jgi:hypothetical protein
VATITLYRSPERQLRRASRGGPEVRTPTVGVEREVAGDVLRVAGEGSWAALEPHHAGDDDSLDRADADDAGGAGPAEPGDVVAAGALLSTS